MLLEIETSALTIPIVLHLLALYALYHTKSVNNDSNQRIHLANLSLSELLICVLSLIRHILQIGKVNHSVVYYLLVFEHLGISMLYLIAMILLTIDRFLKVYLHFRYMFYLPTRRTKKILFLVWVLALIATFLYIALLEHDEEKLFSRCYIYFYPTAELIFLMSAGCTYYYALRKLRTSLSVRQRKVYEAGGQLTVMGSCSTIDLPTQPHRAVVVKRRRFKGLIVVTMVIVTFIALIVIPDQVFFYSLILKRDLPRSLKSYVFTSYYAGFSSDAIIYVFAIPAVKRVLKRKLFCIDGLE